MGFKLLSQELEVWLPGSAAGRWTLPWAAGGSMSLPQSSRAPSCCHPAAPWGFAPDAGKSLAILEPLEIRLLDGQTVNFCGTGQIHSLFIFI